VSGIDELVNIGPLLNIEFLMHANLNTVAYKRILKSILEA